MAMRKTNLSRRMSRGVVLAAILGGLPAAAQPWNITKDWSCDHNPFGAWRLQRADGQLLPPGHWTGDCWGTLPCSYGFGPAFFRCNGTQCFPIDAADGDILFHSAEANNDPVQIEAVWISPIDGYVDVSGKVWWGGVPWHFYRAVGWFVEINGVRVTGGEVGSGSNTPRSAPYYFSSGSGGPCVLKGIRVHPGDQIVLLLRTNNQSYGFNGGYGGLDMTVDTAVPSPADLDGNFELDLGDFFAFFNCFDQQLPCADLTLDNVIDTADFFAFFNRFDAGC